jgi:hypothetical protein
METEFIEQDSLKDCTHFNNHANIPQAAKILPGPLPSVRNNSVRRLKDSGSVTANGIATIQ